ncbi:MAG: hypothetical protein ACYCYE_09910 [Clostridia bacterium]
MSIKYYKEIGELMIKFKKLGIVMKPLKDHFGSFARFNPGVQLKDGVVHMLYRAANSDITCIPKFNVTRSVVRFPSLQKAQFVA